MAVLAENGNRVFKPDFDRYSIIPLFHPSHPQLVANKLSRFTQYMQWAHDGRLFHRSNHLPPYGPTSFYFQKPVFNRLQSSYEDVEFELDLFRASPAHANSLVVFCGGDGLSTMRMEWTMARHPDKYVFQYPIVIPMRGDHPHGTTHINHAGWRLWFGFLEPILKAMDYAYIKNDFTVKDSKHFEFAAYICMRAVAEFVCEVADGAAQVGFEQPAQFIAICEQNIDAAHCVHFLHDYMFLFHQMRRSIRINDHETIDLGMVGA